jgi:orotate phosphoribosyltransferase
MTADTQRAVDLGTTPKARLVAKLRDHCIVAGPVTLEDGAVTPYYVDVKRALLTTEGFTAVAALLGQYVRGWSATAIGGMTMGADSVACAALVCGVECKAFSIRRKRKEYALGQRIEGPPIGRYERCLVVDDVVATGRSVATAVEVIRDAGREVCGVLTVLDRLSGGCEVIEEVARVPYATLVTIDEIFPGRPDGA